MKSFKRWMAICLVSIAAAGLVVACGDDEETCIDDGDCETGLLCNFESETCAFDCTDDSSVCAGDETCTERGANSTGAICIVTGGEEPDPDPDPTGCEDDPGICDDGEICVDNVCESPGASETYYVAMLEDTTPQCDGTGGDPGSDIFGIRLEKADGGTYYADTIDNELGELGDYDKNLNPDAIINGEAPDLDGSCPEEFTGSVYVMGCGGRIAVNFVDPSDRSIVEIEEGDYIHPMEWGGNCGDDTTDEWTLYLCDAGVGDGNSLIGNLDGCNGTNLGSGKAEAPVEVKF